VKYNSIDGFVAALGIPAKDLCLMCFNGKNPTEEQ
jgi:glutamine phosphoribosylpyrophosphate amidotransferase